MERKWRCRNCGISYSEEPELCPDCNEDAFEIIGKRDSDRFRCRNCGITYREEPDVCPDCNESSFELAEEERSRAPPIESSPEQTDAPSDLIPSSRSRLWYAAGGVILVLVVAVLAVGGGGILGTSPCASVTDDTPSSSAIDREYVECSVHELIDQKRAANGKSKLDFDGPMRKAAREMAEEMARKGYTPEQAGNRFDLDEQLREADTSCQTDRPHYWGIYSKVPYQQLTTEDGEQTRYATNDELVGGIVSNVLNAADTREIVYKEGFHEHSVGIYVTSSGEVYVAQIFC